MIAESTTRSFILTAILTALILIWFKPESEFAIAIMCIVIATFFGLISSFDNTQGKHSCRLEKVISPDKLQIRFNQKLFYANIWGVTGINDHPHNKTAIQEIENWLNGKALSFSETEIHNETEYWKFTADGSDLALWILEQGHAKVTTDYLSNAAYENANTQARYNNLGSHKEISNKPWDNLATHDEFQEAI